MDSFGEEIKRERELRGISLREISDATKINMRFLEALENNDFEHLPGGQFNKGFIRAYAAYIGVDPEKMVNSYLLEFSKQEEAKKPYTPLTPSTEKKKGKKWLFPFIGAVLIIMIILFVIVFLVLRPAEDEQKEAVSETNEKTAPAPEKQKTKNRSEKPQEEGATEKGVEKGATARNQPSPAVREISLTVNVRKTGNIHARCNGDELLNTSLSRGDQRTLMCDKELILSLSHREAFQIFYEDQELHFPDESGRAISNFRITKDNLEALIHGSQ